MNRLQKTLPLSTLYSIAIMITMLLLNGCTPTIQVATSDKPIEVNLNVKIEHDIKIKVDKEIEQLFDNKATF
ncbi:YnbE family lipoprotein [Photobacterium kishitanii]|uniref:YnbE family lipoprotein n=1 Tax=Photobacterium kishitanii TaxID=318456 RepID=UPI000431D6E0|nr:YnbE family lipoprotein [Photobacterium kishitanii]PSU87230.1 YnbE family lipoprotein [Photobacterium kishitanii]PSU90630.1 YnbE family lipoprotein [Photobacterium kishitanii]PSV11630.1 YnbE family lipoprotein [Photobacterium kishitanii]CEO40719.1 putative lipoprotein [Photobacterium kishitanii]